MKSKLILGTVQLGLNYGVNNKSGKPSKSASFDILNTAHKYGLCTLDTAESYGNSHELIGLFHKNSKRRFKIITKISEFTKLDELDLKIFKFLDELNVEYIDTLMFHSYDLYIKSKHLIEKLIFFKNQGLIKKLGVSIYNNSDAFKLKNDLNIDVVQLPFNLLDNHSKRGKIINELKLNNKIVHVRSVFLQGLFFLNESKNPIYLKLKVFLEKVLSIANLNNIDLTTLALNYPIFFKDIDNVIIGSETKEQLLMNLKSLNTNICESVYNQINQIDVKNRDLLNPSLWKTM